MPINYGAWGAGLTAAGSGGQNARLLADILDTRRKRQQDAAEMEMRGKAMEQQQANADRMYALEMYKATHGTKGSMPLGLKLKPGERYVPETDTVEAIPGSALYQEMSGKAAKDTEIYKTLGQKSREAQEAIDAFLGRPGGVESQFGAGYTGQLTKYTDPGARAALARVRGILTGAGLEKMRSTGGIGQITEREWPLMLQQMTGITESMNEEDARRELERVKSSLEAMRQKSEEVYNTEWGNTPYIKPMRTGPAVAPSAEASPADPTGIRARLAAKRAAKGGK